MLEILGTTIEASGVYAIAGVVILAVFSIVGLIMFASKEPEFEDVVAAQRKEQQDLITSLSGSSSKSSKKNKNKKWKKREKKDITTEDEVDSGVDDIDPTTESIPEPEPEPVIVPPPSKKKNKKKKAKAAEQIVEVMPETETTAEEFITEEVIASTDASIEQSAPPTLDEIVHEDVIVCSEELEAESTPVDEDLMEAVQEEVVEKEVEIPEIVPEIDVVPEAAPVVAAPAPVVAAPVPVAAPVAAPTKKSKKGKKAAKAPASANMKLQSEIEQADMDSAEVQQIIDILLAKQNELKQWQTPGQKQDPIEALKGQVAELETRLAEEKTIAVAALTKSKDYRTEALHEKSQASAYKKSAQEEIARLTRESEAASKRAGQTQEKLESDVQSRDAQIRRMQELVDSGSSNELSKLKEEIASLKQASMRAQQLTDDNNSLMGEMNQLQQNHNRTIAQCAQADERAKYFEGQCTALQQHTEQSELRLQEVSNSLMKAEAEKLDLLNQLQTVKVEGEVVQVEQVTTSSAESTDLLKQVQKYKADLEMLQLKFEESIGKSEAAVVVPNGDVAHDDSAMVAELKEKNAQILETLDQLKLKNNELREKNWKAMDAVAKAEQLGKDSTEELKRKIFRGLKEVHPNLAIPKEDSIEKIFATYALNQKADEDEINAKLAALEARNAELEAAAAAAPATTVEVEAAPAPEAAVTVVSTGISEEELEAAQQEAEHYKNVLNETEALLSRLQEGVDVEITNKLSQIEAITVESEKKDTQISELTARLEQVEAKQPDTTAAHDEVQARLKKTVAERDLLIREYKQAKEQISSLQESLDEMKEMKVAGATDLDLVTHVTGGTTAPETPVDDSPIVSDSSDNSGFSYEMVDSKAAVEAAQSVTSPLAEEPAAAACPALDILGDDEPEEEDTSGCAALDILGGDDSDEDEEDEPTPAVAAPVAEPTTPVAAPAEPVVEPVAVAPVSEVNAAPSEAAAPTTTPAEATAKLDAALVGTSV